MKKLSIILFVQLVLLVQIQAQSGKWTWMNGSNVTGVAAAGSYGTKGVAAATNQPPGRYQAAYWTDNNGNFWLFGGADYNFSTLNDLWKYDVSTNMWTWVSGFPNAVNIQGVYGVQGIPSVNNCPSARGYGANSWTDKNNNLWLYGGSSSSDDLWKYNIATNEWTWVKGTNPSISIANTIYGVLGVEDPNNTPGTRQEIKSGWVDKSNNLWMFGGSYFDFTSDVWKYNISTNNWVCYSGGPLNFNSNGIYGTLGVESPSNIPPSRWSYTKWKDQNDMFYIFAGGGNASSYNDCWRYNPVSKNWAWISGTNTIFDNGIYGQFCNPKTNNYPSARVENQTVSTTGCTNAFWSFGGCTDFGSNIYNDLWIFNSTNYEWTWVSGSQTPDQTGNYGTKGVYSSTNIIPSKFGVCIWSDKNNNLWVFGGYYYSPFSGYESSNDLWKFEPDTSCFHSQLSGDFSFTKPADTSICLGQITTTPVPNVINFSCTPMSGVTINSDTSLLSFSPSVTTTYTLIGTSNGSCPGKDTLVFTIVVIPSPNAHFVFSEQNITLNNPTFFLNNTSTNAINYEWYYENQLQSTQTDFSKIFNALGTYCFTLKAYNSEGCVDTFKDCGTIHEDQFVIIPNSFSPNGDSKNDVIKAITKNIYSCEFKIFNRWGETVFETKDPTMGWNGTYKGYKSEVGVYYYYFKYTGYNKKDILEKGDITLLR